MPNLNAALGCAQLEQLPQKLRSKRELFAKYDLAFSNIEGVKIFNEPARCESNYWLQTLLLDEELSGTRDLILEITNKVGCMTRPAWKLINSLAPYRNSPCMELRSANIISKRVINIPSSAGLV